MIQTSEDLIGHIIVSMKARNISRAELARRLGVSRAAVTQMFQNGNWELNTVFNVLFALDMELIVRRTRGTIEA